jgi:hypothetical protein
VEALVEQRARLRGLAAPHQGDEKGVLDDAALGVAAADAHRIGGDRLQQARAAGIVLVGKGEHGAADGRDGGPCRQRARRYPALVMWSVQPANVDTVMVAGKIVKRGGEWKIADAQRVARDASASMKYLLERAGPA